MKTLLFFLMLPIVTSQQAQTQTGISGDWRAASVLPDGTPDAAIREFNLDLKADGTSVTGTVTGASMVMREGRIEGNTVTLNGVNTEKLADCGRPVSSSSSSIPTHAESATSSHAASAACTPAVSALEGASTVAEAS